MSPGEGDSRDDCHSREYCIVLADDETDILQANSRILSNSGFAIARTFDNGKELADFVVKNLNPATEPDLVITDLRMPMMDGVEAARTIKSFKPKMKIILASAYDLPSETADLFDGTLKKPFGVKQLVGEVTRCLEVDSAKPNLEGAGSGKVI